MCPLSCCGTQLGGHRPKKGCENGMCCSTVIHLSPRGTLCLRYALVAYTGKREFGGGMFNLGVQVCGLLLCNCTANLLDCCNQLEPAGLVPVHNDFKLKLNGHFKPGVKPIPTHLSSVDMKPLNFTKYSVLDERTFSLSHESEEMPFSIGLYARDYSLDL